MRMGAPRFAASRLACTLLVALVSLLAAAGSASASNCGACGYSVFEKPSCDAQCCFSSSQEQNKALQAGV